MATATDRPVPVVDLRSVVDLRTLASDLREEAVFTLATVQFARRAMRGRKVPRDIRRAMANAERAAQRAREQARQLDDLLAVRDAAAPVVSA